MVTTATKKTSHNLVNLKNTVELNGSQYEVLNFQKFTFPLFNNEDFTGCEEINQIIIYEEKTGKYFQISDPDNKTTDPNMIFHSTDSEAEYVTDIKVEKNTIVIYGLSANTSND